MSNGEALPLVVRVPCDADGRDPLVAEADRARAWASARVGVQAWAFVRGLLAAFMAGPVLHRLCATLPSASPADLPGWVLRWLDQPWWVVSGMLLSGLALATVEACKRYPRVPATAETWLGVGLALLIYVTAYDPLIAVTLITSALCLIYGVGSGVRLAAVGLGGEQHRASVPDLPDDRLPMYTVLVPMYREAGIARQLVRALRALDYPPEKLDIKLLIEADDQDTLSALFAAQPPPHMELVVVPDAHPKTKPRACNHGLARARGELLVIYDAEDQPDPGQLRRAAAAFALAPETTACLQVALAFGNHRQNLLTALFAQEYNGWFGRFLPGLSRLGAVIPLGGTSNHFRLKALRACGGWDPFNVTEDCDLGVRLTMHGYRTGMLSGVTWEEGNAHLGNWIRQRSRWLKGYLQTALVWSRRPIRTLWHIGPRGVFWIGAVIIAPPLAAVLNPLLWLLLLLYVCALAHDMAYGYSLWELLSERVVLGDRWSWPLVYVGAGEDVWWSMISLVFAVVSLLLLLSNGLFWWLHLRLGDRPDQRIGKLLTGLALPGYWLCMSLAAWKGAWQLCTRPHYWEKTIHGLDGVHQATPAQPEVETQAAP